MSKNKTCIVFFIDMGSLPDFSVLKGNKRNLEKRKLHLLFEERLQAANNHNDIAIIFKGNEQSGDQ